MSLSSALARIELEYLSDVVRRNAEVMKDLDHISTLQEDGHGGAFEKSLRVKSMIDELEVEAQKQPGWKILAAIVRSEYRLCVLNAETPLRHNPFLSHWVEAMQRLEVAAQSHSAQAVTDHVSARDIAATRLEMIKRLLLQHTNALAFATPQQLYDARRPGTPFDVQPYVRMLEEEGIYEPSPVPPTPIATLPKPTHSDATAADESIYPSGKPSGIPTFPTRQEYIATRRHTLKAWKDLVLSNLDTNPKWVVEQLTHLPIALPALEFLTDLVTNHSLSMHSIDAKEVVLCFIQHALRLVEHMGQLPDPNVEAPHQTEIGIETDNGLGRDAQSRAISLLILFLRNLIRKGLVVVDPSAENTLYYDIKGMCTSYVWMKEVRDFKTSINIQDLD